MKQFYFSVLTILFSCYVSSAQNDCSSDRYKSRVFSSNMKYGDMKYGEAPQTFFPYFTQDLLMDVYVPEGDALTKRPVIVFAHASAFMFSNKECDVAKAYADTFTRRGYVFASVGYRLGFNAADGESAMRAAYAAIQDGKAAVRYIKENATNFGVDTNNIIFAGSSAGGIMALYAAYGDKESERPAESYGGWFSSDMGCWDCSGNTYKHTSKIKAAISMWGAVLNADMIDDPNAPECMLIHGTLDQIVPFGTDHPFNFPWFPVSSGSQIIDQKATQIGLKHEFYPFDILGINHEFYGSANGNWINLIAPNQYWDTVTSLITQYSFKQIQPKTSVITGETSVYQNELEQIYAVNYTPGSTYCWEVTNGTIISTNANSVTIVWNTTGNGEVKVIETTDYLAEGNPQIMSVDILPETSTGIAELGTANKIMAYPNPANESVQFSVNIRDAVTIKIYNSLGQEVESMIANDGKTSTLNVANYSTGIYTCKAWLSNRELYAIQKLMVK